MRIPAADVVLGALLLGALAVAVVRTRAASVRLAVMTREQPAPLRAARIDQPMIPATRATPFRRSPFRVGDAFSRAVSDAPAAAALMVPPSVPLAPIGVKAIVGGPPWSALMTGLPGSAGARVARPGDRFEPVHVIRIEAERVTLVTPDSSWTVALPGRRP